MSIEQKFAEMLGVNVEDFEPQGSPSERIDDIWTALREAYEEGVNEVE